MLNFLFPESCVLCVLKLFPCPAQVVSLVRTSASNIHAFMKEHAAVQGRMCRDLGDSNHSMHVVQTDSRQQQQVFKLEAYTQGEQ